MGNVHSLPLVARVRDGLANLVSGLGTRADRNTHSGYYVPILAQPQLEAAYRSSWLARKVHDLPPFEMTRAGRNWSADKEQITALEDAETALDLWGKLRRAVTLGRLHGGGAIILGVRQGMPDQPLRVEELGKNCLQYAIVVSRHQLSTPHGFDDDPLSDFYQTPAMWELRGARGGRVNIHPSRVLTFHGSPLPEGAITLSAIDSFWGDPLLYSIKSAIDNAETSQAAVATLLHEMKQDVISIPGLTQQMATEQSEELLRKRIQGIETFKSMFNVLLMDGGDEDGKGGEKWETRQLSFTQHPELLRQFISIVGGAADIPATRLMGESPGGLQSTGKGEQEDFNRMIGAKQGVELKPQICRFDEILLRSVLGSRPDEITWTFAPLSDPDEKEESENEKREAETIAAIDATGLIPREAFGKAVVNRLIEGGRWPGLEQAIDESDIEPGEAPEKDDSVPEAANENDVQAMERAGAITRDQAVTLLTDASPRTLYVQRKLLNAAEFIAWAKGQGFETTTPGDELHVTIAFSRVAVDWMKAGEAWDWTDAKDGKLTVQPGGPRIVERLGDKGAVVLLFNSSSLSYRHENIRRETGASWDWPEYQPHVTITYAAPADLDLSTIEPFRGKLEFGPEIFQEIVEDWEKGVTEK